jgi:DNA-binding protein YbaB
MLQELILAAVNEAARRVDEELSKQVKDLTGGLPGIAGMKIPGMF